MHEFLHATYFIRIKFKSSLPYFILTLIRINQLKLTDKYKVSELESEMKLKKFESQRFSAMYTELEEKYQDVLTDKKTLISKLEV